MKDISNQIYKEIREKILNGNLPANTKLQSTRKLAEIYRVSHPTLLHILEKLEKDGFIEKFARSGVFVKGNEKDSKTISIFKKPKIEERADKIYQIIREKIVKGDLPAHTRLQSIRKLAESYHVSLPTLLHALDELEKDGFIEKFARSGIYIKENKKNDKNLDFFASQYNLWK